MCLNKEFEPLAAYLVKEKALKWLHNAFKHICNAYKQCIKPTEISKANCTL